MKELDRVEVSIWDAGKLLCNPVVVLYENVRTIAAQLKKRFPASTAVIKIKNFEEPKQWDEMIKIKQESDEDEG